MLMRAKSFFGCFQHIQQNIGFIRRAVCEDPLCFDVGHLRHTCELPAQERINRHLQCICDTDKGFANAYVKPVHSRMPVILEKEDIDPWLKDISRTKEILSKPGIGLVDHSRQHCLRDVLALSDFLDSLAKDNVIELHKDTS